MGSRVLVDVLAAGSSAVGPVVGPVVVRASGRVVGPAGGELHRWDVTVPGETPAVGAPAVGDGDVLAVVDVELRSQGWTRAGAWERVASSAPGPVDRWEAVVVGLPREPLEGAQVRTLDVLEHLTRIARGPVTAAALVPHAAPRAQSATHLLRRLVTAGHVRVVGATGTRIVQPLYAPVGTRWAPDRDEARHDGAGRDGAGRDGAGRDKADQDGAGRS